MISITQYQLCTFKTHTYTKHYILFKDKCISKNVLQTYYSGHLTREGRNMSGNWNEGKNDKMRKALLMIM